MVQVQDISEQVSGKSLLLSAKVLKAIANPSRLLILTLLLHDEKNVKQIEDETGIKQPNISRYLQGMMRMGLVKRRKSGVKSFYSLACRDIEAILDCVRCIVRSNTS